MSCTICSPRYVLGLGLTSSRIWSKGEFACLYLIVIAHHDAIAGGDPQISACILVLFAEEGAMIPLGGRADWEKWVAIAVGFAACTG